MYRRRAVVVLAAWVHEYLCWVLTPTCVLTHSVFTFASHCVVALDLFGRGTELEVE
jgi:hypothetical protein